MKKIILVILGGFLFMTCKTKKEITGSANDNLSNKSETNAFRCINKASKIIWTEYTAPVHEGVSGQSKLFTVNNEALYTQMSSDFSKDEFHIVLPFYIEGTIVCKRFRMTNSGTISRNKQKQMRIYSFKGEDVNDPTHIVRLDYDIEFGLKAYGYFDGQSYHLLPTRIDNKTLYITYNEQHASQLKQKFEIKE